MAPNKTTFVDELWSELVAGLVNGRVTMNLERFDHFMLFSHCNLKSWHDSMLEISKCDQTIETKLVARYWREQASLQKVKLWTYQDARWCEKRMLKN